MIKVLNLWLGRRLSILGRIAIVKTLALSKLVYNCSVLDTPTDFAKEVSLQCRRILGGGNLVRIRSIVVAAIFDFMTVEDWGE